MECAAVPVTMGSPRFRRRELGALRITDASFAAGDVLHAHTHDCIIVGFMAAGKFDLSFSRRGYDCGAGTTFVEPAGERHGNRIGIDGARVLVLEVSPAQAEGDLRRYRDHLVAPSHARRDELLPLVRQLLGRLEQPGDDSIESLAWELLDRAAHPALARRPDDWAEKLRDMLHANLHRPVKLTELAREVGVHRVHLGRVFRERFGESLGDYHRRLRLDWAAEQLKKDDVRIGDIALRAGFTDQAHFTRFFKRHTGRTPGVFRAGYQRSMHPVSRPPR